jgi:CheY-like chemotaxis protein
VAHSIDRIAATQPDVVLLDVHLPGGGGQAVVSAMRQSHPQVRFSRCPPPMPRRT